MRHLIERLERQIGRERAAVVKTAGRLARRHRASAYLVGGTVRDLLLGRDLRDVDLVVDGEALELARELARRLDAAYREHGVFQTATLLFPDGWRLDLARTRHESYGAPAALPRVAPADLLDDLLRRDFTINSMAIALDPHTSGELIDPTGGAVDLRRGWIRALHERSFLDDPTRAFRATRFAVRLGFDIEERTRRWIADARRAAAFERLSAARLRRELQLLFQEGGWGPLARLLSAQRLWAVLHPRLRTPRAERARLDRLERLYAWYSGLPEIDPVERWVAALACVARALTADERATLVERVRPPRRATQEILLAPVEAREILTRLRRLRRLRPSRIHAICRERTGSGLLLARLATRPGRLRSALESYLAQWRLVRVDVGGRDLLAAGVAAGPAVAAGLDAALRAKLDGAADGPGAQLRAALRAARRA